MLHDGTATTRAQQRVQHAAHVQLLIRHIERCVAYLTARITSMQNPTLQARHVHEPHTAATLAGTTRQLHVATIATAYATSIAELIRRLYGCNRLALVHRIERCNGVGIECRCWTG